MSETPSEGEVWAPERRTKVSRSSVMRGASVLEPRHRTTAGRGAAEGLLRDARPRLGIGRRRRRCQRRRSRGARRTRDSADESMGLIETLRTATAGGDHKQRPVAWSS
jgi:hypothetical protein